MPDATPADVMQLKDSCVRVCHAIEAMLVKISERVCCCFECSVFASQGCVVNFQVSCGIECPKRQDSAGRLSVASSEGQLPLSLNCRGAVWVGF